MTRVILFLLLIFSIGLLSATECEKIDNLLLLSDKFVDRDYNKSLYYATKAVSIAEKCGNSEKKAWSYFYVAKALVWKKKLDESLDYVNKALKEDAVYEDPVLHSCLKFVKASDYSRLGMNKLALQECYGILEMIENMDSTEAMLIRAKAYYGIATLTNTPSLSDSYFQRSSEIIKRIPNKRILSMKRIFRFQAYLYHAEARAFLDRKIMDSANHYLILAYKQSILEDITPKNNFIVPIGDYFYEMGNNEKALIYYLKGMDEINKYDKDAFIKNGPNLLKRIYQIYHQLGDTTNEKIYFDKFNKAQQDFGNHVNEHVLKTANKVVEEKVEENKESKEIYHFIISVIIVLCLIIIGFLVHFYDKKHEKKDLDIAEKQKMLLLKEQEALVLSSMVDGALDEVIKAAKMNVPEFWGLFQKSHPDFISVLTKVNPNLKTSELILCAYIFLGFNTKDVAEYTFKAIQTVKNNKHNLRKRLGLPQKQDLTVWIRSVYGEM